MKNIKTKGAVAATVLALGGLAGVALASNDGRSSLNPPAEPNRQTTDLPEATGPDTVGSGEARSSSEAVSAEQDTSPAVTSSSGGSGDEEGHDSDGQSRSQDDHDSDHQDSDGEHDDDDD